MKIYLDNCCYSRPYDNQSQIRIHLETIAKLNIQHEIEEGRYDLVVSSFLLDENSKKSNAQVKKHINDYMVTNMKVFVQNSKETPLGEKILEIEATGIKPLDASHLAAALQSECDYFITTDDRLLKYKTDRIKIVTPTQFITETR